MFPPIDSKEKKKIKNRANPKFKVNGMCFVEMVECNILPSYCAALLLSFNKWTC